MMNKTKDKSWLKKEFDNLLADGEFAKAKRLLEEHKGSIGFADFHYFYSMLYGEQELYPKALSYAEKAYKNTPKNVALREAREDSISILYIVRTYAWLLSSASPENLEENTKALNLIDYVISEREKSNSLSKDLLYELNVKSNILYRLGRYYEARENINKTADLFPSSQLPRFIQLQYEKTGASFPDTIKPNVVDYKSSFIKLIMAIIAALISAYIIRVIL